METYSEPIKILQVNAQFATTIQVEYVFCLNESV